MGINENILCRVGCVKSNEVVANTLMRCNAYDIRDDWTRGDRVFQYTIPKVNDYQISYQGTAWIGLNAGGSDWEVYFIYYNDGAFF